MIAQYFIKVVIPLVFSAVLAGFGWFAYEELGATIAAVSGLLVSGVWTCYSWITGSQHTAQPGSDPRRIVVLAKRRAKSGYKLKLQN